MRIAARLAVILSLMVALAACTTDEVLQLESQIVSIQFKATGPQAQVYDIFVVTEVTANDPNSAPVATTEPFLACENALGLRSVGSAPWRHSFRVSVLRAGETEYQPVTDDVYLDTTTSVTPFDNFTYGATPGNIFVVQQSGRFFRFQAGGIPRLSRLNAMVVAANASVNVLHQLNPTYGFDFVDPNPPHLPRPLVPLAYLCSTADAAAVALAELAPLAGAAPPYTLELQKGDTIRVEAFKDPFAIPTLGVSEPSLGATISVDGVNVEHRVVGDLGSSQSSEAGISFTYTSR